MVGEMKLILTRGLPASGKSTWAKQWVSESPETRIRVNRDDLRLMIFNQASGLTRDQENTITFLQQTIVLRALQDDRRDVVVDDTNLNAKFAKEWLKLAAKAGAEVEWNDDFLSVPLATCLLRDQRREAKVGAEVIKSFYDRYIRGRKMPLERPQIDSEPLLEAEPYSGTPGKPKTFLIDLDGTIAHNDGHRGFFEWHKVGDDKPHEHVIDVVRALTKDGYHPLFVSGRDASCFHETFEWIWEHVFKGEWFESPLKNEIDLLMRPKGDMRKDSIIKLEIFNEHIRDNYDVKFCLDDRNQVVRMYRDVLGIPVLQVRDGDF